MTEAEWLTATDPQPMLEFLRGKVSDRKLRLFAVACCRRLLHLVTDDRTRTAIKEAEDVADGRLKETGVRVEAEARAAFEEADNKYDNRLYDGSYPEGDAGVAIGWSLCALRDLASAGWRALQPRAFAAADDTLQAANSAEKGVMQASQWAGGKGPSSMDEFEWSENRSQVELLRDIFGNPFHPIAFNPSWRSESVLSLATGIYADRAFDRLPVLADALEEAGCDHPDMLNHCRGPGPHVRGCWVVDLVLGKE